MNRLKVAIFLAKHRKWLIPSAVILAGVGGYLIYRSL